MRGALVPSASTRRNKLASSSPIVVSLALLAVVTAGLGRAARADEPPLDLAAALALAAAHNPAIAAARMTQAVDAAGIDVARERPNPELRFEGSRETPHEAVTLIQTIETGKRGRRVDVATAAARVGETETAIAIAEVRADVRRAYYALAAAQRRSAAARAAAQSAQRVRAIAQERFDLGDVAKLDVLEAELAALQVDNEATELTGEARAAAHELNALIGRPFDAPTVVVDEFPDDPLPELDVTLSANLGLQRLNRQLAEGEARVALARAQQTPDPSVEAAFTHAALPDFENGWRAAFQLSIPVFTRHTAAARAEEATLAQLRLTRQAEADRLRAAVAAAWARADAQRRAYRRFRDEVLPRTDTVEAMAQDSYRSGKTGLVSLLEAVENARDIRVKAIDAGLAFQNALADLDRAQAVGVK
jgi:cobalt-zinc-cadmium efflux system outer membrane protein